MLTPDPVVFVLDVDNTLLDNDRFSADLTAWLDQAFGSAERERYWSLYGGLRDRLGYADYLGALQLFRAGCEDRPELLRMSAFLLDYPFAERLYPGALAAIGHLASLGRTVIVSDGDIVFQPRKIQRSGLWDAVQGRVLVCLHKERSLGQIRQRFPARHHVLVDDKPLLLAAMKRVLADGATTVFVRQGHYAAESAGLAIDPAPDLTVKRISDLCELAGLPAAVPPAPAEDHQRTPTASSPEHP